MIFLENISVKACFFSGIIYFSVYLSFWQDIVTLMGILWVFYYRLFIEILN